MICTPTRLGSFVPALAVLVAALLTAGPAVARKQDRERDEAPAETFSGKASLAVVSLARQRISLYDANGGVVRASVSSGQTGYETPAGVYSILQKKEEHYSNLYDDASMPFMQRITWSGVALHAGALPGYPASHGCVRLPSSFAEQIFPLTRIGMRVVISRDDVAPVPVSHPLLFQPEPLGDAVTQQVRATYYRDEDETTPLPDVSAWPQRLRLQQELQAAAAVKSRAARDATDAAEPSRDALKEKTAEHNKAQRAVRSAETAVRKAKESLAQADKLAAQMKKPSAMQAAERMRSKAAAALSKAEAQLAAANAESASTGEALATATEAAKAADAIEKSALAASKEAEHKMLPVSVFISSKARRLYVRQGREPVLDAPVAIRDPEQPIGTHVFTALGFNEDGNGMRWNVVSLTHREGSVDDDDDDDGRRSKRRAKDKAPAPTDAAATTAALDRITIPPEVLARVSKYVWPGSSLIVSDEELSKETGKATEFVVVMSGEPQGALKIRPRQDRNYDRYDRYDGYQYEAYSYPYYSQPRVRRYYYRPSGPGLFSWW